MGGKNSTQVKLSIDFSLCLKWSQVLCRILCKYNLKVGNVRSINSQWNYGTCGNRGNKDGLQCVSLLDLKVLDLVSASLIKNKYFSPRFKPKRVHHALVQLKYQLDMGSSHSRSSQTCVCWLLVRTGGLPRTALKWPSMEWSSGGFWVLLTSLSVAWISLP